MGIDYGLGKTNIDRETGIRYGIIPAHRLPFWYESAEPDYGEPTCPKCGNPAIEGESHSRQHENGVSVWTEHPEHTKDWECSGCGDYRCDDCEYLFDGDEAYPDECLGYVIDEEDFKASSDDSGDVWVFKSEFYTVCGFCSPCAPGAGYLTDRSADCRAYCPGPEWFDKNPPFDIRRVSDGLPVYMRPRIVRIRRKVA